MSNKWLYPGIALGLIVFTGAFLGFWKGNQKLGKPGIQVLEIDGAGKLAIQFPETNLDYAGRVREISPGVMEALPDDTTVEARLYRAPDGFEMQLMGVLMGTDRTSIHQPQFCLTGQGFNITETIRDTVRIEAEGAYDLPVMILKSEKEHLGVMYTGYYIYWFVADGLTTADHWERMWWMAKGLFTTGELQRWAYVSCFAVVPSGLSEEAVVPRMKRFLSSAIPTFQPRPANVASVSPQLDSKPQAVEGAVAPVSGEQVAVSR